MREILFRGKGDKKYNDGMWYFGVPILCYDGDWQICTNNSKRTVIPETIGQYTGLADKNGTKIFEGDIVLLKGDEEPYQVVMDNFYDHDIEVIGNIYDNPELLEGDGSA